MIDFIVLVLLRYFLFGGSQGDKNVIPLNLILNARQGLQITNEGLELKVFGFSSDGLRCTRPLNPYRLPSFSTADEI